uniref:6-phosphogluconate dehydrogenase NADP-binding domain-containing protein n=1 Tax=Heterosigma akashiwo TaxID=2829 RepID=A0A6V1VYN4_HETAK
MAGEGGEFGFIGLGIMGTGMASNLLKGGRDLIVWNRSANKIDALKEISKSFEYGGRIKVASSPMEVIGSTQTTFSMLSTPKAARAVFYADDGILAGAFEGKSIVDCATLQEEDMQEFSLKFTEKGGRFLEAPVSGSKGPAEAGQLIFLTAGERALFDAVQPELDLMGKASFYLGDIGQGTRMKLVVNKIMGTMLASLAEGMVLAKECGLSQEELLGILDLGAMANPMFKLKGPAMAAPGAAYPAAFPLKHAQKDMKFALALAAQLGVELPVAAAANAAYEQVLGAHGDSDFAAVYEAVGKRGEEGPPPTEATPYWKSYSGTCTGGMVPPPPGDKGAGD